MYPNQGGFPGQYPSYGGGMPQPSMPFGSGFTGGMPQPGMPQAPYGQFPSQQPPMPDPYQAPMMGQPNPYQAAPQGYPPMPPQQQQFPPQQGGMYPQMPAYGSPMAAQQTPPGSYPTPPQQAAPGAYPPQQAAPNAYPSPQAPSAYPPQQSAQGAYPMQTPPNPNQQSYGYGMPPNQQPPIQQQTIQQQYVAPSYGQAPPSATIKKGRPTVLPHPGFDAANDAAALRKAMKGFGTDEDGLINILCRRPNAQRMEIVRAFKTAYGKDLISEIKSEVSGNFECLLVALCQNTVEYYCNELYQATSGAGTDEDVLIEIMCTMSNAEIRQIGATYYRMFGQSLEQVLRDDTGGSIKRLMTSFSVGGRDESMVTNVDSARADAQALQRAGVGRWGTDESEFNRILCLRNYNQLKLICQEYQKLTGNSLEKDIKREFSGDIEDALLAIIRVAENRPEFFARRLHKSMAGLGTNDRSLIRLVVTRSEIDMLDIKDEFQRYYSKSLKSFIKGDTSGHYKHGLYVLIGENKS